MGNVSSSSGPTRSGGQTRLIYCDRCSTSIRDAFSCKRTYIQKVKIEKKECKSWFSCCHGRNNHHLLLTTFFFRYCLMRPSYRHPTRWLLQKALFNRQEPSIVVLRGTEKGNSVVMDSCPWQECRGRSRRGSLHQARHYARLRSS